MLAVKLISNPAAAAELLATVPAGKWWRPIALRFVLTTDATVGNRFPALTIDDGTNVIWRAQNAVAQAASLVVDYNFCPSGNPVSAPGATATTRQGQMPDLNLGPASRIRTTLSQLLGVDQFSSIVLYVDEEGGEREAVDQPDQA
jgi:hypothetical protein